MTGAMWAMLATALLSLFFGFCGDAHARTLKTAALKAQDAVKSWAAAEAAGMATGFIAIGLLSFITFGVLFALRELL